MSGCRVASSDAMKRRDGPPIAAALRWAFAAINRGSTPPYKFLTPSRAVSNPLVICSKKVTGRSRLLQGL